MCDAFDKFNSLNVRTFPRLNEAYITLIPKCADAESLYNFRPISIIHLLA